MRGGQAARAKLYRKGDVSLGKILWQNVWKLLCQRLGTSHNYAPLPKLRDILTVESHASGLNWAGCEAQTYGCNCAKWG